VLLCRFGGVRYRLQYAVPVLLCVSFTGTVPVQTPGLVPAPVPPPLKVPLALVPVLSDSVSFLFADGAYPVLTYVRCACLCRLCSSLCLCLILPCLSRSFSALAGVCPACVLPVPVSSVFGTILLIPVFLYSSSEDSDSALRFFFVPFFGLLLSFVVVLLFACLPFLAFFLCSSSLLENKSSSLAGTWASPSSWSSWAPGERF